MERSVLQGGVYCDHLLYLDIFHKQNVSRIYFENILKKPFQQPKTYHSALNTEKKSFLAPVFGSGIQ